MNSKRVYSILVVALAVVCLGFVAQPARAQLPGAIFTTLEDGTRVNANIYNNMRDVYLDGGPPVNAPPGAAGLDPGWYYFQVTNPSGKILLSTDPVRCRRFHVNDQGLIDRVCDNAHPDFPCDVMAVNNGGKEKLVPDCWHMTGVDVDHGATTVQLWPYLKTPNPGGVYKVWATPVGCFQGDPELVDDPVPGTFHGFLPACSKTDNYKVRGKEIPPKITVRKFIDCNYNGVQDAGEADYQGWKINVWKPSGEPGECYTTCLFDPAETGNWLFEEDLPDGWVQTALYIDGDKKTTSVWAPVTVIGYDEETHDVLYGNAPILRIKACKFYDRDGDGVKDDGDGPVPGIKVLLEELVAPDVWTLVAEGCTDDGGCVEFSNLLPGTYRVTEVPPPDTTACQWHHTTDLSQEVTLTCEGGPKTETVLFGNFITGEADFDTKGYWHNKNGLDELEYDFIAGVVNLLDPYSGPGEGCNHFDYFGVGEEPFDGLDEDGNPVPGAFNDDGSPSWGAGSWQAEVSYFLVDSNADAESYGHREQLAQQLLAFIFNVQYRVGGGATIMLPSGDWVPTSDLIDAAIAAWCDGTDDARVAITGILDALNNNNAVPYILDGPGDCPGSCDPAL